MVGTPGEIGAAYSSPMMTVDEITVPSVDVPGGLSFGPVTLETVWDGALETSDEMPVTLTPRCRQFLGIRWYLERYHTRGVFTVTRDHIVFRPTASVSIERAGWWRRAGFRLFSRGSQTEQAREHTAPDR